MLEPQRGQCRWKPVSSEDQKPKLVDEDKYKEKNYTKSFCELTCYARKLQLPPEEKGCGCIASYMPALVGVPYCNLEVESNCVSKVLSEYGKFHCPLCATSTGVCYRFR